MLKNLKKVAAAKFIITNTSILNYISKFLFHCQEIC